MSGYKEEDPNVEILPLEDRAQSGLPTQAGHGSVPANYSFSGVETGWLARRRGRALGRTLDEQTGGLLSVAE